MMKNKLTACVAIAALCVTTPLVVKGDTTDGYLTSHNFFESAAKVEVVDDSSKNKNVITEVTEIEGLPVVEKKSHPLEPLMNAIIYVESRGNPKAHNKNGDCVGILQITKICVRECNRVLQKQGSKKRYTYADRWDKDKSIEMFYLLQDYYNPKHDIDKAIRIWNKRPSYKKLVMKRYNSQK